MTEIIEEDIEETETGAAHLVDDTEAVGGADAQMEEAEKQIEEEKKQMEEAD